VQVTTKPGPVAAQLKVRTSVTQLSPDELARFRAAMTKFKARADNKGFDFYANWHGVAFELCQHHNDLFLPWHRGYLYHFELGLQAIDPSVTVPWWDWIDEAGLPPQYTEARAEGANNPLTGASINPSGVRSQPGWPTQTSRNPGAPGEPGEPAPQAPPLRKGTVEGKEVDLYEWMMESTTYSQFQERCWRLHDNIHVWVGGTMEDQNWAAYDPIFWAHHTMVDRLWRLWQTKHPSALPNHDVLETSMAFASVPSMKVREVLDVTQLGYDYVAQSGATGGTA
jgi:tyrosinase